VIAFPYFCHFDFFIRKVKYSSLCRQDVVHSWLTLYLS